MVFQGLAVLLKPILALHIINFSSCRNYCGGAKRYVCPPPPNIFMGGSRPPPPPQDRRLCNRVAASLNRDLDRMKSWADRWKVTFEPTKSMIVSRKRTPSSINLYLGDCQLAVQDELEILGVIIDSKLSWSKHISSIASRAGQKLGALRKVANKLDIRSRATVYKAQVRSIREYACLCWTSASSIQLSVNSQLDNIQRKALKITGVNEATACSQLSIPSLTHRREVAALTVFYKMYTN